MQNPPEKKLKILITGANGFVGTNLTDYLAEDPNLDVYAMVRPNAPVNFLHEMEYSSAEKKTETRFRLVEANIKDPASIDRVVQGMDVVVHLAGKVADWGDRDAFFRFNVDTTLQGSNMRCNGRLKGIGVDLFVIQANR